MKKPLNTRRTRIGSTRFEVHMELQFLGLTPEGVEIHGIGVVRNVSMRGALIDTSALVEKGDQLTLFLTLPDEAGLLEIPAVAVRWVVRRHQLGVEFLKLDSGTSRQLMRYLTRLYNEARAQREITHAR